MNINRTVMSGNLTKEPELRATQSGKKVLLFSIASNGRRKDKATGEWVEVPNYIDCVVPGSRAESLAKMLSKGTKVVVEGKLRFSRWETKDGQKRSKHELVVTELDLLSKASAKAQEGDGDRADAHACDSYDSGFDDLEDVDIFF